MDLEAKKKLLRKIPSGLYVVGIKAGNELHGFTASWVCQVSMKPPCILVGVKKDSRSFDLLKRGRVLTLNYVRKDQKSVIEHFFRPVSHDGDRLGSVAFSTGKTGAPILDAAVGYLECEVREILEDFGDHAAVVAEVIEAKIREDVDPLIMSDTPWHYGG